jgi:hypothetical protein
MSDSSQPKNLYQGFEAQSIDTILKDCVIDLSGTGANMNDVSFTSSYSGQSFTYATLPTITIGGGAGATTYSTVTTTDTITLDSSSFVFNLPTEWIDCLPPLDRVQNMCEKYPGLKIAFENFKVVYEMVKDDYDNPVPKK